MHLRWFRVKSGYNSSYFMEGSVSWSVPAVSLHHLKAVVDMSSLNTLFLVSSLLISQWSTEKY
ncbi:hypothetical protein BHE74_00024044 [Ensete ventricosum]|nr:hypothetical protein GW17_00044203 [Ensete ventricosum]RWW68441.1 hypothetical protein BHE74_00024044 [Ensete ventricosum]